MRKRQHRNSHTYCHSNSHTYCYCNRASSSSYSHAEGPPDTDGAAHSATTPDTAATASYNDADCSPTAQSTASHHAVPASTFPASYSSAAAQSLNQGDLPTASLCQDNSMNCDERSVLTVIDRVIP